MTGLVCASCGGGVHLMTSTVFGGPNSGKTTFYLAHKERSECEGALAPDVLALLAREGEARAAAEARRVRKPEKRRYHEARAAQYRGFAQAGLGVPV